MMAYVGVGHSNHDDTRGGRVSWETNPFIFTSAAAGSLPTGGSGGDVGAKTAAAHPHFNARAYNSQHQQLSVTLDLVPLDLPASTCPDDVNDRLWDLQAAIMETEGLGHEARRIAEEGRNARYVEVQRRLEAIERERNERLVKDDKRREAFLTEYRCEIQRHYHDLSMRTNARIDQCAAKKEAASKERFDRSVAVSAHRDRLLEQLALHREQQAQQRTLKSTQRAKHCAVVLQRHALADAENFSEKADAFNKHRDMAAQRLEANEQRRAVEAMERRARGERCHHSGRVGKATVKLHNGNATIEVAEKDFEARWAELHAKQVQQHARYLNEVASRNYALKQRAEARKVREEKQRRTFNAALSARLERGNQVLEKHKNDQLVVERTERERLLASTNAAKKTEGDLAKHLQRARERRELATEKILERYVERWMVRCDRVLNCAQSGQPDSGPGTYSRTWDRRNRGSSSGGHSNVSRPDSVVKRGAGRSNAAWRGVDAVGEGEPGWATAAAEDHVMSDD